MEYDTRRQAIEKAKAYGERGWNVPGRPPRPWLLASVEGGYHQGDYPVEVHVLSGSPPRAVVLVLPSCDTPPDTTGKAIVLDGWGTKLRSFPFREDEGEDGLPEMCLASEYARMLSKDMP